MSQINSQSTQAEECGVSKLSAEVDELLDSLPLRTRCTIRAEFTKLAAAAAEDAHKIFAYHSLVESLHEDARELKKEFYSIKDAFDLPNTHTEYLVNTICRESTESAITEAITGEVSN